MIAGIFDWIPNPVDVVTAPFRWGLDTMTSAGSGLLKEGFQWLVGLSLSGVSWLFGVVWNFLSDATTPNLYATWFVGGPYRAMTTLAVSILMLAVMLAVAETIWNRDGSALLRSVAQDLPKAIFILTGLLFLTTLGLGIADGMTDWLMAMFSGSATDFSEAMANVAGELHFGAGLIVVMLTAIVMMVVLLFVAALMLFREGFIFLLTAITAVMVVLDVYRPTRGAGGRSIRLLAGVIVAKPLIALCFAVGGAMLGSVNTDVQPVDAVAEPGTTSPVGGGADDAAAQAAIGEGADDLAATFGTLLAGLATMAMAAFAPFTVLKLFPAADAAAAEGGQRAVAAKASSVVYMAGAAISGGAGAAAGAAGGAASGAGSAGAAAGGASGPAAAGAGAAGSAARKAG